MQTTQAQPAQQFHFPSVKLFFLKLALLALYGLSCDYFDVIDLAKSLVHESAKTITEATETPHRRSTAQPKKSGLPTLDTSIARGE